MARHGTPSTCVGVEAVFGADLDCFTDTLAANDMLDVLGDVARLCVHRVKGGYTFVHFVNHSKIAVFLFLAPNRGRQAQPCIPEAPCILQSALPEPPPRPASHGARHCTQEVKTCPSPPHCDEYYDLGSPRLAFNTSGKLSRPPTALQGPPLSLLAGGHA